mmetsp:Transcript_7828/g.16797  ORF Transcript_7828/g.16797 Transcript_7828/m.16797 type:complete len:340 (-) Transcript_7828:410-1429(-)|eukprot:CAMPEP_0168168930 /NCGR_PEP_ID=MMETSP0139_2-20121125/3370_1 /TAXON_ID=44445 /ORGANISM="Pseudo-nitzschia australis, Strain 10249 10 AB" /LENGTH=339 /DNA_ID=CAMNT_0008086321 /DNA_START=194 /DNA_END=1213 /DNA_ORIENTATION=-
MPFKRKAKTTSPAADDAKPKRGDDDDDEEMVDSRNHVGSTRTMRRSASDAFGDEIDLPGKSPLHKKQNTSSVARPTRDAPVGLGSSTGGRSKTTIVAAAAATSSFVNNNNSNGGEFRTPIDSSFKDSDDAAAHGGESGLLHLAPRIQKIPTRPMAALTLTGTGTRTTASNSMKIEKPVERFGAIQGPKTSNVDENLHETTSSDRPNKSEDRRPGVFLEIALLCLATLVVFSVVTWSGLLLNERSVYQLELSTCRERLAQVHHLVGLTGDEFGDDDDINNNNRLREQLFYWQELESQVQYWKKEAKKHQQYGEGIKEQCQEDLEHLFTKGQPQAEKRHSM